MKQTKPLPNPTADNSFLSVMQRHRGGALLNELSETLRGLVAGVQATGKSGTLTLSLKVQNAQHGHNAIMLTDKLDEKIPVIEAEASYWFGTAEGELLKEDPRQREFKMGVLGGAGATNEPEMQPLPKTSTGNA